MPIAVDATVSCPLLPTYLRDATLSSESMFLSRAKHKVEKHAAGCTTLGRDFIAAVFTTFGGLGPQPIRDLLTTEYSHFAAALIAAGSSGYDASYQFENLLSELQAAGARMNAICVQRHTAS